MPEVVHGLDKILFQTQFAQILTYKAILWLVSQSSRCFDLEGLLPWIIIIIGRPASMVIEKNIPHYKWMCCFMNQSLVNLANLNQYLGAYSTLGALRTTKSYRYYRISSFYIYVDSQRLSFYFIPNFSL